ncbi:hypothetical protein CYLTODRAFT_377489 [Cylindrobasidium torrendii FP15055 ss-10]|uniref:C2H2-type domain-containing protein n=1 Tax=Cylindrobasidium torrendii FP15055 ss-10 TaxID=1314674 RepID=A0A0D7B7S0_9AGAR|nr:hypothetical protein CYLTODRAFT_377489 [Cylindrobasidium torrendii FP15055 ss-10]
MGLHDCEDCGYRAPSASGLREHQSAVHTGARPFTCTYSGCPYTSGWRSALQRHLQSHNGVKKKRKRYPCTWEGCGLAATDRPALRRHEARHTGPRPYPCVQQGCATVAFATMEELLSHKGLFHRNGVQARNSASSASQDAPDTTGESKHAIEETFTCKHASCDYTTRRQRKLELHEARHSPETPFVCSHHKCRFSCSKIKHLKRHVKSAHGENVPTQEEAGRDGLNAPRKLSSAQVKQVEPNDDELPTDAAREGLEDAGDAAPEESEEDRRRVSTRTRVQRRHRILSSPVHEPSSDPDDDADFVDESTSQVDDDASYVDENTSGVEDSEPLPKRRRLPRSTGSSVSTSSLQKSHKGASRLPTPSSSQTFRRVEVSIPPAPEYIRRFRSQSAAPRPTTTSQSTTPRPSRARSPSQSTPIPRQHTQSPERRSQSLTPLFLPEEEKPPSPEPKPKKRKRHENEDAERPPTKAEVKAMIQEGVRPLADEINSLAEMIQLLVRPRQ